MACSSFARVLPSKAPTCSAFGTVLDLHTSTVLVDRVHCSPAITHSHESNFVHPTHSYSYTVTEHTHMYKRLVTCREGQRVNHYIINHVVEDNRDVYTIGEHRFDSIEKMLEYYCHNLLDSTCLRRPVRTSSHTSLKRFHLP